jgi:hypothetical protein
LGGRDAHRCQHRGGRVRPGSWRPAMGLGNAPGDVLRGDTGVYARGNRASAGAVRLPRRAIRRGRPTDLVPRCGWPVSRRSGNRDARSASASYRGLLGWLLVRSVTCGQNSAPRGARRLDGSRSRDDARLRRVGNAHICRGRRSTFGVAILPISGTAAGAVAIVTLLLCPTRRIDQRSTRMIAVS